jgi:23S rRNA pseudouridine955/2504/2580 synthase
MKTAQQMQNPKVKWIEITAENEGQRLDNFLITLLKGVPKSRIYRIVRKGEVRVNKGRCAVSRRLKAGDTVRIPPVRVAERTAQVFIPEKLRNSLETGILFEDEALIVFNKPSGFAVHGGSGIDSGIIEGLRYLQPEAKFLELVHRLDRDTSGCLLIAKKRSALRRLHEMFRTTGVKKTYLALLAGNWTRKKQVVTAPLQKNIQKGGERMVVVHQAGKPAETLFRKIKAFKDATLVAASPKTGRTHQIRVHAQWMGHAIVGDTRYGEKEINQKFLKKGYNRLFLHAEKLQFEHPLSAEVLSITAPLPKYLQDLISNEN